MKKYLRLAALLTILPLLTAAAYADHRDGSYCIATGYIAFDLSSFMTPDLPVSHLLRLIRADPQKGIYQSGDVPMENFDVMWMRCAGDQIEVSGSSDLKSYESYTIDISVPTKAPHVVQHKHGPIREFAQAHLGRDGYLSDGKSKHTESILPSTDAEHNYELVLSSRPVSGYCVTTYGKAELLQLDLHDIVTQRVVLYEFAEESCGD